MGMSSEHWLLKFGQRFGWIPGVFDLAIDRRLRAGGIVGTRSALWGSRPREFDMRDYTQRKAYFGCFERSESAFLGRAVTAGSVCIDVGANVGLVAAILADEAGPTGRVIALEPVPENFRLLTASLVGLEQVVCINCAAGAEDGKTVRLERVTGGDSDSAATSGSFSLASTGDHRTEVPVEAVLRRLDILIPELLGSPTPVIDLVKIDVEGAEEQVVASLGELLSPTCIRALVLEAVAVRGVGFRAPDVRTMQSLLGAGYSLHAIGTSGRPLRLAPEAWIRSWRHWPRYGHRISPSICVNYCALAPGWAPASA